MGDVISDGLKRIFFKIVSESFVLIASQIGIFVLSLGAIRDHKNRVEDANPFDFNTPIVSKSNLLIAFPCSNKYLDGMVLIFRNDFGRTTNFNPDSTLFIQKFSGDWELENLDDV